MMKTCSRCMPTVSRAQSIDTLDKDIAIVHAESRLREVPRVGEGIAKKIVEFLDSGRLKYYEDLKKDAPKKFDQIVRIEGVGPNAPWLSTKLSAFKPSKTSNTRV